MKFGFKTSIRRHYASMFLLFITGCSTMGGGLQPISGNSAADSASGSNDAYPIKLITSQLLTSEKTVRDQESVSDITQLVAPSGPYAIENGDVLSVIVWDHPELASAGPPTALATSTLDSKTPSAPGIFIVDHQGLIQFPYVGTLKVGGLTEEAARTLLAGKLAYYINKPNVTLVVQSYRSKRIYVDGEVKTPGVQPITDIPMTLVEAVNRAGGFLPTADQSQILLSRQSANYRINLPQMVQRGVNPADIMLKNGDVIRVRSRDESKVFVSGEVIGPRSLMMHNGRLSLNEALGEAGGVNPISGDSRQVYVVRKTKTVPVVYRLDAYSPGALALAEGFELEPKDIVYVAATTLANWQRTISQLLPGGLSSTLTTVVPPR